MSVACQFAEHLPCPLALGIERFCGLYFESHEIESFRDVWDTGNDPVRRALKRGISAARENTSPVVQRLQDALEDTLPSDPEGYTVRGVCVAEYRPTQSEAAVHRQLHLKAAPPGSLLAVLAKHLLDETLSENLRYAQVSKET